MCSARVVLYEEILRRPDAALRFLFILDHITAGNIFKILRIFDPTTATGSDDLAIIDAIDAPSDASRSWPLSCATPPTTLLRLPNAFLLLRLRKRQARRRGHPRSHSNLGRFM